MTPTQALRFIERRGVILESARHSRVANLADVALGERRQGSWWGHARGREFFALTRRIRSASDVLVCRLVDGKITYVHRRLWPALVRLAPVIGRDQVASIREVHMPIGTHQVHSTPLAEWVPADVRQEARKLTAAAARQQLGSALRPAERSASRRSAS